MQFGGDRVNNMYSAHNNSPKNFNRHFVYRAVEEDWNLLVEKARNCVFKNLSEDVIETRKINDMKPVKSILREAGVDERLVVSVERHSARVPGRNEDRRPLKVFAQSKENP